MHVVSRLAVLPRLLALCLCLFGAQALAGYAPAPDGYVLLDIETSERHVVAGGARFFIPSSQWGLYSGASTVALPHATINAITQIPRERTLLRQIGYAAIYVIVGQSFWWVPSPAELDYWDNWETVNNIPNSGWADVFYDYSKKVLVRERSTTQVYLWIAGAKVPITNASDLAYYGGEPSVETIPLGTLNHTSDPWCGVLLRERSSSTVYELGYLSGPTMLKRARASPEHGVVPDGALTPFPETSALYACIG